MWSEEVCEEEGEEEGYRSDYQRGDQIMLLYPGYDNIAYVRLLHGDTRMSLIERCQYCREKKRKPRCE